MKGISTRKPKSKHRKTCPEKYIYRIYRLYCVEKYLILWCDVYKLKDCRHLVERRIRKSNAKAIS